MGGDLEQNIQALNDFLSHENSVLQDNIKTDKDINNIEGEINRSHINYTRLSSLLFFLSIISILLFLYTISFDVMYPVTLFINFFSGIAERQLLLVLFGLLSLVGILYFDRMGYSKLVTSITMTGLLYVVFLNVFGINLTGFPLLTTFILSFYLFEF